MSGPRARVARLAALALAVLPATAPRAAEPAVALVAKDFAHGREIVLPPGPPAAAYRIAVPADVYARVRRPDLGDLRVYNGAGEAVPTFVRRPPSAATVRAEPRSLPLFPLPGDPERALSALQLSLETRGADVSLHLEAPREAAGGASGAQALARGAAAYLIDARALREPVAALALVWADTAPEGAAALRVEASDDLAGWRTLRDGAPVANLRAGAQRLVEQRIELAPTRARFYRLTWQSGQPLLAIASVAAEPADGVRDAARSERVVAGTVVIPDSATLEPPRFVYDLGAVPPVDRVNLRLAELNSIAFVRIEARADAASRWDEVARTGVYRLAGDGREIANGWLPIPVTSRRLWRVSVESPTSGLGRQPPALAVGWLPHELVFVARGAGPFLLAYGSARADAPQDAALAGLLPGLAGTTTGATGAGGDAAGTVPLATLGAERELAGDAALAPIPTPRSWRPIVLWAALGLAVLLLGWMAWRLARDVDRPAG